MNRIFLTLLCVPVFLLVFIALPTEAAGLIPCDGPDCQACHFVKLGQNVLEWLIGIMASIIALVFAIGGMKMVMSGGSSENVSEAKSMMTNSVVGFVILLSAWLIIDTSLKLFMDESKLGVWNEVACVKQPEYTALPPDTGRPVVGGGTSGTLSNAQMQSRLAATSAYRSELCAAATAQGIGNQCDSLQALMSIESAGDPNAVSGVGAAGLMQVMPDTARSLDPSLAGLSDAEIRTKLKDPSYNMQIGTKLYAKLYNQFDGDLSKTYAAYNGGAGANGASANCSGQLKWQCEWDDNAHTVPNTGYAETRKYVGNVNSVRCSISSASGC